MTFDPSKLKRNPDTGFWEGAQTRDGREVVIYTMEAPETEFPIHGRVGESLLRWDADGVFHSTCGNCADLINTPPKPVVVEGYINFYLNQNPCFHKYRNLADESAMQHRIACIPIKFTIGDGLSDEERERLK